MKRTMAVLKRVWRDVLASLVEVAGAALLVIAAYRFDPQLGLLVGGLALLVLGYAINER